MATTAMATTVATRGKVHGVTTTARAVPSKAYDTKAMTQTSHSHASRTEQPTPVAFQIAQIDLRLVQPSRLQIFGPTIEPGAFSPHFSSDLTFPNSNLALEVYHTSTAQGDAFLPSYSNPNREQHLSRQVIELTNAFVQQTTLVNQLLQRIEMQLALD
ncbi:hypothetical protein ACFX1Z_006672 [Malus domestica]